jgi:hypothetical protein
MAEKRIERRLAAILAADVAGYSRLSWALPRNALTKRLRLAGTNSLISRLLSITVGLSNPPVMASSSNSAHDHLAPINGQPHGQLRGDRQPRARLQAMEP